jgi:aspartyl-tRNA(Asn)/glutamyl-tRNA(Gln) amidotransferase subunit A
VPCGFDDGLPIGMQIIGQPFDEATLFRVGAAFQSVTDFHTRGPAL